MEIILEGNIVTPIQILKNHMIFIKDNLIQKIKAADEFANYNRNCQHIYFDDEKYICPGLINIHTHGALGKDMMDGDVNSLKIMSEFYLEHGVTSFLATTISSSKEEILKSIKATKDFIKSSNSGSEIIGINIEGPYLNKENVIFYGAQNTDFIRKLNEEEFNEFVDSCEGLVKIITLGACPRTNIFKLEPQYTVSNSRLLYCMWYVKNLDSYSRTSS